MVNKQRIKKYVAVVLLAAMVSSGMSSVNRVQAAEYPTVPESVSETVTTPDASEQSGRTVSETDKKETETATETETKKEPETEKETEPVRETEPATEQPVISDKIKIEDTGVYAGMKKAYKDGYEPVVDQGAATIVIPITADLGKDIQEITVTPNLGDTMSSPFIYRNYQKSFKKTKEPVNDGREKREVFLIAYSLPLRSDRINGVYPVIFDVKADTGKSEVMASFTIYVQITDGKNPSEGENVDMGGGMAEARPESQPKLIISKCTSNPERIEAGQEFVLTAEIENTNKNLHIQNMTIEVGWSETGLSLLEDSKTIYVDRLGSGKTLEIPLKFKAENNLPEGRYDITLSMNYDNPEAVSMNSMGTISVDIYQPLRIELEAGKLPENINAGDTITLQIQALNLGRGNVYNARCTIDVPGLSSGTSLFLGNIAAGSAVGGDIKIFAGMKDEAVYGSTYGPTSGKLILSYEDEEGNVYSEEVEVSTTVNQLVVNAPSENPEKQAEKTLGIQWVIGVVVIIAVLAAGGIYLSKRKKENENK